MATFFYKSNQNNGYLFWIVLGCWQVRWFIGKLATAVIHFYVIARSSKPYVRLIATGICFRALEKGWTSWARIFLKQLTINLFQLHLVLFMIPFEAVSLTWNRMESHPLPKMLYCICLLPVKERSQSFRAHIRMSSLTVFNHLSNISLILQVAGLNGEQRWEK